MTQQMKKGIFKILPTSVAALMVLSLVIGVWQGQKVENAMAAADDYTVVGGDIAAFPVVGAASVALNAITITDVGGDDFTNDPETLTVVIDSTNYPAVKFDTTVSTVTVGGNCGYDAHNALGYSPDAYTVTIPVTGGVNCAAGEFIVLGGLKVSTIYAQTAPGAFGLISVDNTTTSAGAAVTTATTVNLAVTAADAAATVTISSPTVGAVGATVAALVVPFALDAADTIDITFPAYINVSGVAAAVTGTFEGASNITCAAVLQVVTCTTDGTTATSGTIIMTGITSYYVGTTDISVFEVEDEGVAANDIATDTTVALTDVTAADAAATVVLASPTVGGVGATTASLTLPFVLDANDTIDITFPAYINVSGVGAAVTGTLEGGSNITCAAVLQVVTCTTDGATAISGTIIMTGITSSYAGTTDITVFEVEDEGVAANDIATDTTVALTDVTAADLTTTNVQPASLMASAVTTVTVTFTTVNPIPADGKIKVTFGPGFNVAAASAGTCSSMDGAFATAVAGQVVTLTRSAGTEEPAGAQTCTVATITNPIVGGTTGAYTISTTNSTNGVLDTDAAVTADIITGSSSGGSGSGSGNTAPSASIILNGGSTVTSNRTISVSIFATNASDIIMSENSDFSDAFWQSISSVTTFTLSVGVGTKTVYAKVRNSSQESALITETIYSSSTDTNPTPEQTPEQPSPNANVPETTPAPEPVPGATPAATTSFAEPADRDALLAYLGVPRNTEMENKYRPLVSADAKAFGVTLSQNQLEYITNFIAYGINTATQKLGDGERRAVIRDYLATTQFADVRWDDIDRIVIGQKPVHRNLSLEQKLVSTALRVFKQIYGHNPNFKNGEEDLAWNTLMYRIRFTRDLAVEKTGIAEFRKTFAHTPSTPLDWATVRVLGYVNK